MTEPVTKKQIDDAYDAWKAAVSVVQVENEVSAAEWRGQAELIESFRAQGYKDPSGEFQKMLDFRENASIAAVTEAHKARRKLNELCRRYTEQEGDLP